MPAQNNPAQRPLNEAGIPVNPMFTRQVGADGNDIAIAYQLAGVPAGVSGSPAGIPDALNGQTAWTLIQGGDYIWDAQFTGSNLILQTLAADGTTARTTSTLATSGTQTGKISFGTNSYVRLSGATITALYSSLSKVL